MNTTNLLGRLIRARRSQLGKTQRELAQACGVTDSAVSLWETGETQEIRPETLERAAVFLGLSMEDMLHPGGPLREALTTTQDELAEALRGARTEALARAQLDASAALSSAVVRCSLTVEDLNMIRVMIDNLSTKNLKS